MEAKRYSYFLLPYLLLFLAGVISVFFIEKEVLFHYFQAHKNKVFDVTFPLLTHLGDGVFYLFIVVALLFFSLKNAFVAFASYASSSLVTQVLKRYIFEDALRPSYFFRDASYHMVEGVDLHGTLSFPSGHATTAFSLFLFLTLVSKKPKIGILFFVLAAAVSYTRVYLSQHFPEDVLVGSFIGVVFTLLVFFVLEKRIPDSWDVPIKQVLNRN